MGFGLDVAVRQGADAAGQGCWFGPGSDLDQQESVGAPDVGRRRTAPGRRRLTCYPGARKMVSAIIMRCRASLTTVNGRFEAN